MAAHPRRQRVDAPYPMIRRVERTLEPDYAGPVFVWDIDKTYLDTRFSELKGLLTIPFEFGIDKHAIEGTVQLLHGLREGPSGREHRPIFFVSASPPQIASSIERKMLLDGVEWDGITYKDPLRMLLRRQPDQLREQVAFKLSALLVLFGELPPGAQLHLFGDDLEKDAFIYAAFADAVAGRLRGERLRQCLVKSGVRDQYARAITARVGDLPVRDAVAGIYIRLERDAKGAAIKPFGPRVVGSPTFAATAEKLESEGLLSKPSADRVRAASPPSVSVVGEGTGETVLG